MKSDNIGIGSLTHNDILFNVTLVRIWCAIYIHSKYLNKHSDVEYMSKVFANHVENLGISSNSYIVKKFMSIYEKADLFYTVLVDLFGVGTEQDVIDECCVYIKDIRFNV